MRSSAFSPLLISDYRRLWLGQIVSVVGDKIDQIAMAVMVYSITGSMLQMGVMLGTVLLPAALFGLPAGALVDRLDRRRVMIGADLLRCVAVLAIPFAVRHSIWWAYAIAFVASAISLFFTPAKRALIPDLVPSRDLMASNSLDNASEAVAELAGLAVGGIVVASIGYTWAFVMDSVSFLFSAICILRIGYRQPARPPRAIESNIVAEILEGIRSIARNRVLRSLSGVYVFAAMLGQAVIALCYSLALERYRAGAEGLAMLDAAITVGILAGAVLVGRGGMTRPGLKFLAGIGAFGAATALLGAAESIWFAMAFLLLAGIANMYFFIPATTLYQTHAEESVRGRVLAASTTLSRIAMVLGIVLAGAAAERMPISWLAALIGVGGVLLALAGSTRPALREA